MSDTEKQGFRAVEPNVEEMEQKIRRHRKRIAISIAAIVVVIAVLIMAAGIYFELKEYQNYAVSSEVERGESASAKYESFAGRILRYNNDGVFYTDMSDNLIWNQAYEMQNPSVDICETYAAIADLQGNQIYIMNTAGVQGSIKTGKPIEAVRIANQGTIAVLTQADGTSYLELYNKSGESLASGEIHVANSGYPLDISLSNDANKLAVSILDISKGKANTTITFYNFGAAGQNEIDNMVGSYAYEDAIIPEIKFISNDRMIAFGDHKVILFEGKQSPEETNVLNIKNQVKSIFYEENYFGLVYSKEDSKNSHKMEIYDMKGKLRLEQEFRMDYQDIEFLKNHEICIRNEYECEIYTLRGVKRFSYKFDQVLHKIFSGSLGRRYTFILDDAIEKVKLK